MTTVRQTPTYARLLSQLAARPPTTCKATTLDFEQLGMPLYKDHFAMVIDNAFSPMECRALLQAAEENKTWEEALVNIGAGRQALRTDVRQCDRILLDDQSIADGIMARVLPYLPEDIVTLDNNGKITGHGPVKRKEQWRILRLNERLRFLKYTPGNYFRPHCDGSYQSPEKDITFLTVHLYLNGGEDSTVEGSAATENGASTLSGGATRFFASNMKHHWDLNPRVGSVVVFQHRNLLHSGEDILQGTKYTLRSDVLYRKVS